MTLGDWNARLEAHFTQLRQERSAAVGDRPVFALEHGLNVTELDDLEKLIRQHILCRAPAKEHALPWVVYAAEVGYRYEGDEYWQTFEAETPGWVQFGRRSWIRERFIEFSQKFGGAKPTGPWAEWFTNICWPITHAVLPQYLQREMAEILFEIRHAFTANLFASPAALGAMIATRSLNATSRFQIFAQDTLLVGQIAAALLIQSATDSALLLPSALKRIGGDLERERQARQWLLAARTSAARAQMRGLTRDSVVRPRPNTPDSTREQLAELAIEPRLALTPQDGRWDVWLELPDLSPLLERFPDLRNVLAQSRCVVAGSSGRPLWPGRLLRGSQRVRLEKWPTAAEPLLRFERSTPQLDHLLRTDCLLRPGPRWLFRVASDGRAYELQRLLVRAGRRYVLLTTADVLGDTNGINPAHITCGGINALHLDVPKALSEGWLSRLRQLGLGDMRAIDVWPVGVPAASWDGDGRLEWLTSDPLCIAIRADHTVVALHVTLDDDRAGVDLRDVPEGHTTFLELPPLSAGTHRLKVSVAGRTSTQLEDGCLDIVVRAPRPWVPGVSPQGALTVLLDPGKPSLEDLWDGRVSIDIHGPAGREVRCTASLFERGAPSPLVTRRLPPLPMPVDATAWRRHFSKYFQRATDVSTCFDRAQRCFVEVSAEELGAFSTSCEREFVPLRWAVGRSGSEFTLTLVDEAGADNAASITKYDFEAPDVGVALKAFERDQPVASKGGLYVARTSDYARAVVLPPTTLRSFADLRVNPRVTTKDASIEAVLTLFSVAGLWHDARLAGDHVLAATRRRDAVNALMERIFTSLGGDSWGNAERHRARNENDVRLLAGAVSGKPHEKELAARIIQERQHLVDMPAQQRTRHFAALAKSFLHLPAGNGSRIVVGKAPSATLIKRAPSPEDPVWLCEFAVRMASCSPGTIRWAGEHFKDATLRLRAVPVLARAARFLVLAVDIWVQPGVRELGPVYYGWEWELGN